MCFSCRSIHSNLYALGLQQTQRRTTSPRGVKIFTSTEAMKLMMLFLLRQVRNYQETQQQAIKKAKRGRRKSILLFGAKQNKSFVDDEDSNIKKASSLEPGSHKAASQASLGRGISAFDPLYLASLFSGAAQPVDTEVPKGGLVLSRGGSAVGQAVDPLPLTRGWSYAKSRSWNRSRPVAHDGDNNEDQDASKDS